MEVIGVKEGTNGSIHYRWTQVYSYDDNGNELSYVEEVDTTYNTNYPIDGEIEYQKQRFTTYNEEGQILTYYEDQSGDSQSQSSGLSHKLYLYRRVYLR